MAMKMIAADGTNAVANQKQPVHITGHPMDIKLLRFETDLLYFKG